MGIECSINGCSRSSVARTWCRAHWKRWKKYGDPVIVLPPRPRPPMEERFLAKVAVLGPDDCWEWQASRDPLGYGFFRVSMGQSMQRAHRVAWGLANGPISEGHIICHRCDNPPCCNPAHLFLGTDLDNSRDKVQKGRSTKGRIVHWGELSGRSAKLTEAQVREIRTRYAAGGVSQSQLGREFGVGQVQIGRICRGTRWAPLT